MADKLHIDQGRVRENAAQLQSAAGYLQNISLFPQDSRTTLAANEKGKAAYGNSQDRIALLGVLLEQEAQNIRGLGLEFAEFDEMMGSLGEQGPRHSVITAKK